jgi:hypothetical protein
VLLLLQQPRIAAVLVCLYDALVLMQATCGKSRKRE